jgi:two-component system response regulator YesN
VLTAYDEFEYAREALQLGAENYLLKPINVKELEFSVRKALDNLNSRRIAEQTLNSNYCVFKDNLLSRWLDGSIEESELRERAGIMSINIFCRNYCVVLLKLLEQSLKINTFLDNIKHYLCSEYNCYYLIESHGAHAFIIGGKKVNSSEVKKKLQMIIDMHNVIPGVFVIIGPVVTNSAEVSLSYQTSLNMLEFLSISTQNSIVTWEDVQKNQIIKSYIYEVETIGKKLEYRDEIKSVSPVIERVLAYINDHYSEPVTLKSISTIININTSYLGYIFKNETGEYFSSPCIPLITLNPI